MVEQPDSGLRNPVPRIESSDRPEGPDASEPSPSFHYNQSCELADSPLTDPAQQAKVSLDNSDEDNTQSEVIATEIQTTLTPNNTFQPVTSNDDVERQACAADNEHEQTPYAVSAKYSTSTHSEDAGDSKNGFARLCRQLGVFITNTWVIEISSWVLSASCVVTVLGILSFHDNQPLSEWPYDITINTFLTLFVTIATTSLMISVSSGISQLKWNWYQNGARSAADLDVFDNASRGAWGSINLLASLRHRSISSLGAAITILVLAVHAVTQQTITYSSESISEFRNESLISPRATYMGPPDQLSVMNSGDSQPINIDIDLMTQRAINNGLVAGHTTLSPVALFCPTTGCTWPRYRTLGVCASFADMTDRLSVFCRPIRGQFCVAELPGVGKMIREESAQAKDFETFLIRSTGDQYYKNTLRKKKHSHKVLSKAFKDLHTNTLADFYVLWNAANDLDGPARGFQAIEINLHYCVQTLESSVTDGKSSTNMTETPSNFKISVAKKGSNPDNPLNETGGPAFNRASSANLTATLNDTAEDFNINMVTVENLGLYMGYQLNGRWKWAASVGSFFPTTAIRAVVNAIQQPPYDTDGLKLLAQNLATSLTNHIRSAGFTESENYGHAHVIKTFVHINWWWITLLAVVEGASLAFLICVIVINRRTGSHLWRSSNMALVQSLEGDSKIIQGSGLRDFAELQEYAKNVKFRLNNEETGWELSTVQQGK